MKLPAFRKLKIRYRILIFFQFMMVPTLMIFIVLQVMMHKMQDVQSSTLLKNMESITAAYNVENSLLNLKELKANYMLDGDRKWLREFNSNVDVFNSWYNRAFVVANSEEERDILSVLSLNFSRYLNAHKQIIVLADSGRKVQAIHMLLTESMKHYNAIYKGCEQLIASNRDTIAGNEERIRRYVRISIYLSSLIIGCFVVFGVLLVILITRSIVDPIMEMESESGTPVPVENGKSETERLRERFDMMVDTIKSNQQKLIVSERRAAVGEIAAGISHELNNPIGIIYGFTELLLKREGIAGEEREFIEDIHVETARCKRLLGEMLNFARNPDPEYIETDIVNLINETVRLFRNQEKYGNISFDTSWPSDGIILMIDAVQIRQVLLNIIINSCEAMEHSGEISVSAYTDGTAAVISIGDTGPGIDSEILEKVFTPFFTTKAKGVGLGLAICRDIVEKHNGSIEILCNTKYGAEFIITLPGYING